MTAYVQMFPQGSKEQKDLLGGKGANLAEMTRLGLPVPPGFTITTEACRWYMTHGSAPEELAAQVDEAMAEVERELSRRLGDVEDPLLVAVRSGSKMSMPGMMETVLNVGLNDQTVQGLARRSGSPRFAMDSYRRLLQMYGRTVLDVDAALFEDVLDELKHSRGVSSDAELTAEDLTTVVGRFQQIILEQTGTPFPQDPREQLRASIIAVFESWNAPRAVAYRNTERIPHDLGTAVNVCSMVFGNLDDDSASGVALTRDPATGVVGAYGDFLVNAQGEDVVAGIRNTRSLPELEELMPAVYAELMDIMHRLEVHYRDLCDVEFTVESGRLWMLQTRVGKRTAEAAFLIATTLVDESVIDEREALTRVTGAQLTRLMFPRFAVDAPREAIARGMDASPGAAVGRIALTTAEVLRLQRDGASAILVRRETTPDDLEGMIASAGILTSRGGRTSHAAVVARGLGHTAVCGVEAFDIDESAGEIRIGGEVVARAGDTLSIDGSTGEVFAGSVPVEPSAVVQSLTCESDPDVAEADELVAAVHRLLQVADGAGRDRVLQTLLPLQRADFVGILRAMDGRSVTVRLLDPPLHEFLPDLTELSVKLARQEARGVERDEHEEKVLAAVRRLHEQNPMLGLRGVRLALTIPGLYGMQTRAILEAAAQLRREGLDPRVEIMVPLVSSVRELREIMPEIEAARTAVAEECGEGFEVHVGTMIELPRAALRADEIAQEADFFSFGTNDLTQTTWGYSRDDVEAGFFFTYRDRGILLSSPFETLDQFGVGELVRIGAERGRSTKADLKLGICGEHGGDPASIAFFHHVGLDYVSCSPFRVPVARLEAGRAALLDGEFTPQH